MLTARPEAAIEKRKYSLDMRVLSKWGQIAWRLFAPVQCQYWAKAIAYGQRIERTKPQCRTQQSSCSSKLAGVLNAPELRSLSNPSVPAWDDFDAEYYLRENPDVARAKIDPLKHFTDYGKAEGRHPNAVAATGASAFRLNDFCSPDHKEDGPRAFDEAFFISVLTPAYNTPPRYLRELFQTLLNQRYANWEWVVVDDGSSTPATISTLRELATKYIQRLRLMLNPANAGISAASNIALAAARGTHAALVDHDDLLPRDALFAVYEEWKKDNTTKLFFTDECKLFPDGTVGQFWPKPDWSPAYLENTMCVGHLSVYEMVFLRELGGFRSLYDGTR